MNRQRTYKLQKDGRTISSRQPWRYAGWRLGKIFGRLDCASGRRMKPENRVFFLTWDDAIAAGYRPCKNCRPTPSDRYTTPNRKTRPR
ncbi:MAG: Ada metal-binding domain-containing protein [Patescibacteria group bacterium]|jgi:methylphosphotriester-DNA--protein-cysteine methyltransferase